MTLEEIRAERAWLDGNCRHLVDLDSRRCFNEAGFALELLWRDLLESQNTDDTATGERIAGDTTLREADYRRWRGELEQRLEHRPAPTTTPQALQEGWFLPFDELRALGVSVYPRRYVPRVKSKFNVFDLPRLRI